MHANPWGYTGAFPSKVRGSENSGSIFNPIVPHQDIKTSFLFLHILPTQEAPETQRRAGVPCRGMCTSHASAPLASGVQPFSHDLPILVSYSRTSETQGGRAEADTARRIR